MQTLSSPAAVTAQVREWRSLGLKVAFVPTMGNLHDGHLNLCRHGLEVADKLVVSIFVNPLQFGANEDLDAYPRTLQADSEKLQALGADMLFAPGEADLYPNGREGLTTVSVPGVTDILCGASRPGHFDGVTTVVNILFNIVQPDVAIFGEKDFQQLFVIRRMVCDLFIPVEIMGLPTTREADGLAMSSRNGYLSQEQRQQAVGISQQLKAIADSLSEGRNDFAVLERQATEALIAQGFEPDYVSIRSAATLAPASTADKRLVVLVAARLGGTRLIDNTVVSLRKLP